MIRALGGPGCEHPGLSGCEKLIFWMEPIKTLTSFELRIVGIDEIHLHVLARVPDHNPRHWVGLAKKECSAYMKRDGLAPVGGVWAVRCECKPVRDGGHFENTVRYIGDHGARGAVVHSARSPGC